MFKLLTYLPLIVLVLSCKSDDGTDSNTWTKYHADDASSNYSPLEQIDTANVQLLKHAWTFQMNDMQSDSRPGLSQCTPIVVDGVMYTVSAKGWLYAVNASHGNEIWSFDPFDGGQGGGTVRGVAYWSDGDDRRILFGSADRLLAIDAENGNLIRDFGENGRVDLRLGLRDDHEDLFIALTSPGIVYKDLIIVGGRLEDLYGSPPGYIRAYNCRSGELVWTFHTIPLPGEYGYETWPSDAYQTAGGVNNWSGMSVDMEKDLVFASLGSPSYDFYGADRPGQNLFGNCVLALRASTGEYVWHFQTVHHDLWDYDLPAPPNLVKLKQGDNEIEAVAQVSKQGFVYILHRETGEPVFPIEERVVPQSDMPGEQSWPTQPIPTRPKPFTRQNLGIDDLMNFSDSDYENILAQFHASRYEGLFTPSALSGTVMVPGTRGGAQWGGAGYDPESNMLYIRSMDAAELMTIVERDPSKIVAKTVISQGETLYRNYCAACHGENRQGNGAIFPALDNLLNTVDRAVSKEKISRGVGQMPGFSRALSEEEIESLLAYLYEDDDRVLESSNESSEAGSIQYFNISGYTTWVDPSGNPAMKPPWGTLSALNLSSGEYEWQIPLGNIKKYQLEGMPETGMEGKTGPVVTAGGLIFISGAADNILRALDKRTGKTLWTYDLPAMSNANVSTYMVNSKQYVVLSVGGTSKNPSGSVVAFSLP